VKINTVFNIFYFINLVHNIPVNCNQGKTAAENGRKLHNYRLNQRYSVKTRYRAVFW